MKYVNVQGVNVALHSIQRVVFFEIDQVVDIHFKDAPTVTFSWEDVQELVNKKRQLQNLHIAKVCMSKQRRKP